MKGFREFILRGNVIDLAVAVVIGAAFTALVTAVVTNIFNPLIGAIFNAKSLDGALIAHIHLTAGTADVKFGAVIGAIINFIIIAAIVYFVFVVPINALLKRALPEARRAGSRPPRPRRPSSTCSRRSATSSRVSRTSATSASSTRTDHSASGPPLQRVTERSVLVAAEGTPSAAQPQWGGLSARRRASFGPSESPQAARLVLGGPLPRRRRRVGARHRVGAHATARRRGSVRSGPRSTGIVVVSGDGSRAPSEIAIRSAIASGSLNRSKLCTRR